MARMTGLAAGALLLTSLFGSIAQATESESRVVLGGRSGAPLKLALALETSEVATSSLTVRLARVGTGARRMAAAPATLASKGSKLDYAVSQEVRLGLGYDYITGEDLDFEVAETGSLDEDYTSHRVMVRAHLQF